MTRKGLVKPYYGSWMTVNGKKYRPPSLYRNQGEWRNHFEFSEVQTSKLRPAKVLRKSQLFYILRLSGSPFVFHHVYRMFVYRIFVIDFKRIFPDLTRVKTFFYNSSDERLCIDIKYPHRPFWLGSSTHWEGETIVLFFCGEQIITSTQPSFRHNRVRHKQGWNTITDRERCSGVRDQFDISGVFETTEFEIVFCRKFCTTESKIWIVRMFKNKQ